MPIQRMPRYLLLLTDLKKYTNVHHPDFEYLPNAIEGMNKILQSHNKQIDPKAAEYAQKLLAVSNSIANVDQIPESVTGGVRFFLFLFDNLLFNFFFLFKQSLVQAGRRLVKEEQVLAKKISKKSKEPEKEKRKAERNKSKEMFCFLFSDLIILCQESEKSKSSDQGFVMSNAFALRTVKDCTETASTVLYFVLDDEFDWKIQFSSSTTCKTFLNELQSQQKQTVLVE